MAFNYNLNINKIIKENTPLFLYKNKRVDWIRALIKPVKVMHDEFLFVRADSLNKVAYNSQVILLEKILNDKFDNTLRRIYIADDIYNNTNYIYRKAELRTPIYLYRKWKPATSYIVGQYAIELNKVYVAINNNTNSLPSANPSDWEFYKMVTFFRRKSEYGANGFIVMVPTGLVYDVNYMKALVNYYKLASKRYTIQNY